jgi:hypothetical protein
MSKPGAHRRDRLVWAKDRDAELLQLHIRLAMEHQANAAPWERWQKPYFEACPENRARHQNQGARAYLSNYLDAADTSGEAADGHLGSQYGLRKRANEVMTLNLKLMEGDVERAEALAKQTGLSFDYCLKVYSDLNIRNTPSYMGGEMIQKVGKVMGDIGPGVLSDRLAVQAENQRDREQIAVEMIKAARSQPIAYGDRGIINMMRHGRP